MTDLPAPDPAEGTAAEEAAAAARRAVEVQLSDGSLDLKGLFAQVDEEGDHHVIGHMHVKAALLALPHIGEVAADGILEDLGIDHEEHIDVLGSDQREALVEAAIEAA